MKRLRKLAILFLVWRTRPRRERPQMLYGQDGNPEYATLEDTIALSWITMLYSRYGTDDQLDGIYHKWHTGHWRRGPRKDPCTICGIY